MTPRLLSVAAAAVPSEPDNVRRALGVLNRQAEAVREALALVRELLTQRPPVDPPATVPPPLPAAPRPASDPHWRHSRDYREVIWYGHRFAFSKTQAAVVELLDQARASGAPDVDQAEILQAVGSRDTRLSQLFKRGDAARAWGLLLVRGELPGTYRLAERPAAEGAASGPGATFRHCPAYRSVSWFGNVFHFSKTQGLVVEVLDLARRDGEPDVHQSEILRRVGSDATRLSDLFRRDDGYRAWGKFIVQGELPGSYRIADAPPPAEK